MEEKKKQEQKDKKKKKHVDGNEENLVEDIPLKDIVAVPNQEISGYIFIDFPQTEQQINELKEAGLVLDKVLYLTDAIPDGEEEVTPGAIISQRLAQKGALFNLEQELEAAENIIKIIKEFQGEENVREVSI